VRILWLGLDHHLCARDVLLTDNHRRWINESVIAAAYTYRWGVALPIWWASGLSFQIALMAVLGIVAKLRVPYAHTSLEFIRIRYGAYAHGIFVVLNLINNIFGCGGMILAGAQLVSGMTGMHIAAAGILIPAGGKFSCCALRDVGWCESLKLTCICCSCHLYRCRRPQSHFPHGLLAHHSRSDPLDLLLSRSLDE
jgi:hypothetical protein